MVLQLKVIKKSLVKSKIPLRRRYDFNDETMRSCHVSLFHSKFFTFLIKNHKNPLNNQ